MIRTSLIIFAISALSSPGVNALSNKTIPDIFVLGVATASYQIEGGWNEDGKGVNLWDWYCHTFPDRIENKYNGDIACDSYHKWEEDVAILKDLGVKMYRLSISWSRILPQGTTNEINEKGVRYYKTLLKALKDAGIYPIVTLYHWDLPLSLHEMGGWTNPLLARYFGDYARLCFSLFGDLVGDWITINEPETTCFQGYGDGKKAPGYQIEAEGVYMCAYVSLLAHATAYRIYDEEFRASQHGAVTIVLNTPWIEPASDDPRDIVAAEIARQFWLGLFANPIYHGNFPQLVIDRVGNRSAAEGYPRSRLPVMDQDTVDFIRGTHDQYFFINNYASQLATYAFGVNENITANASWEQDMGCQLSNDEDWKSVVNWVNDTPWGLRKLLNYIWNTYNKPWIVVTENGWAETTDTLNDTDRITYLEGHLSAVMDTIYEDGVLVIGYTVWSIMDNFEWTHGYNQKLGLYQVDFTSANRTRTPKASAKWLKKILKTRCLVDKCDPEF